MIKDDTQYNITKAQAEKFAEALQGISVEAPPQNIHPTLVKAQREAIKSQWEELQQELKDYEELKSGSKVALNSCGASQRAHVAS